MAKPKRGSATSSTYYQPVATTPLVLPRPWPKPVQHTLVEDHRTWHPLKTKRPSNSISGTPTVERLREPRSKQFRYSKLQSQTKAVLAFANPKTTILCIRRKTRKQVLFALKRTGKGSGSKKHFNQRSKIRC